MAVFPSGKRPFLCVVFWTGLLLSPHDLTAVIKPGLDSGAGLVPFVYHHEGGTDGFLDPVAEVILLRGAFGSVLYFCVVLAEAGTVGVAAGL